MEIHTCTILILQIRPRAARLVIVPIIVEAIVPIIVEAIVTIIVEAIVVGDT